MKQEVRRDCNPKAVSLLGRSTKELIERALVTLVAVSLATAVIVAFANFLAGPT